MARPILIIALVLLSACQTPGSSNGCGGVQIDWVDFIQVGTAQYVAGEQPPTPLGESDLGPVVAQVKFKVAGNVCDPGYRLKDGDAAFLEPGTPIYQLIGHPQTEVLAARSGRRIVSYAATGP